MDCFKNHNVYLAVKFDSILVEIDFLFFINYLFRVLSGGYKVICREWLSGERNGPTILVRNQNSQIAETRKFLPRYTDVPK